MRSPLIRQGAGPADLLRIYEDHIERRRQIDRMISTANATEEDQDRRRRGLIGYRTAPADQMRLRMIPAVARGVAGAIPGTNPATEICR